MRSSGAGERPAALSWWFKDDPVRPAKFHETAQESRPDAPAAIDAVQVDAFRTASPLVNLSELLAAVPGIQIRERQNYAQDLQLSVRGFGTRSTFGVRGVRILIDGIPATMPDGQGQASSASLTSAKRIEILRGPVAQLYGNAAGGAVDVSHYSTDGYRDHSDAAPGYAVLNARAGIEFPAGSIICWIKTMPARLS